MTYRHSYPNILAFFFVTGPLVNYESERVYMEKKPLILLLSCLGFFYSSNIHSSSSTELTGIYEHHCRAVSDIYEHIPILRQLASECSSVVEIGIRTMVSSWGVLLGLTESKAESKLYIGIDLAMPPAHNLHTAKRLAEAHQIQFNFWQANDMSINIPVIDMLFIDSLHTYCHLTYELEKFSPNVRKYITLHDTSDPWGNVDEPYSGNYSEYPAHIDRTKRGLWPAAEDFLARHPEWKLKERRLNNHGFTILERVSQ